MSKKDKPDPQVAKILDGIEKPLIPDSPTDRRFSSFFEELSTVLNDKAASANDATGDTSRQLAKVCAVLPQTDGFAGYINNLFGSDFGGFTTLIAYNPRVHSGIPDPHGLATPEEKVEAIAFNLLPESSSRFVASSETNPTTPEVGQWVWVTYQDNVNKTGGVYLEPVKNVDGSIANSPTNQDTTRSSFDNGIEIPPNGAPGSGPEVERFVLSKKTTVILKEGTPNTENRVRRNVYGALPKNSPLLVRLPGGQKVHVLVKKRFDLMNRDFVQQTGLQPFTVASGWRRHRWKGRAHYEAAMIKLYGSVAEGRKYRAYASPHETGLAIDLRGNGIDTKRGRIATMRRLPAYRWLTQNAYKYGFSPYKLEPWHWELQVPRDSWATGSEFTSDLSVYVEEQSAVVSGPEGLTRAARYAREEFV